jgi:hypothetical protein
MASLNMSFWAMRALRPRSGTFSEVVRRAGFAQEPQACNEVDLRWLQTCCDTAKDRMTNPQRSGWFVRACYPRLVDRLQILAVTGFFVRARPAATLGMPKSYQRGAVCGGTTASICRCPVVASCSPSCTCRKRLEAVSSYSTNSLANGLTGCLMNLS